MLLYPLLLKFISYREPQGNFQIQDIFTLAQPFKVYDSFPKYYQDIFDRILPQFLDSA